MVFGFGKNRKSPVREVSKTKQGEIDSALANSEETLGYLSKKEEILEGKIRDCVNLALECSKRGDRSGALNHLKRKKLLTNELNKLKSSLLALESQSIALEGAKMQHMAISALSDSLNAQNDSSKFDDLLDEIEESKDVQQEILDTMNCNLTSNVEFEDELSELMANEGYNELDDLKAPSHGLGDNTNDTKSKLKSH